MKIFGININLFPKSLGSDYEDNVVLKKVETSEKEKNILLLFAQNSENLSCMALK